MPHPDPSSPEAVPAGDAPLDILRRNTHIRADSKFVGEWVAIPLEDFEAAGAEVERLRSELTSTQKRADEWFAAAQSAISSRSPETDKQTYRSFVVNEALEDMRQASTLIDGSAGTSEYQMRLVALAMIARHFLRECDKPRLAPRASAPTEEQRDNVLALVNQALTRAGSRHIVGTKDGRIVSCTIEDAQKESIVRQDYDSATLASDTEPPMSVIPCSTCGRYFLPNATHWTTCQKCRPSSDAQKEKD